MNYDNLFITTYNEYYPYEKYIVKTPKAINIFYDDALLTEIFIPSSVNEVDRFDIYIKLKCKGVEFRLAYFDFNDNIREAIRGIIQEEFGNFAWQSIYTNYEDDEDYNELIKILKEQEYLITQKYGGCPIKESWIRDERIIKLLTNQ